MTKTQTKADLEKLVKSLQRKVAKLERELAFEKEKLEASQAVSAAFLRSSPRHHVTPLPQNAFPWAKS